MLVSSVGLATATTLQQAQLKLDTALVEQELLGAEIAREMIALTEEVESLDDQAIQLSREVRQLELNNVKEEANKQRLEKLVAARKAEFQYVNGVLKEYIETFDTRIAAAETPLYANALQDVKITTETAGDDVQKRTVAQVQFLSAAADRILEVAGGSVFSGKATDENDKLHQGQFLLLGPSAYFSSDDKSVSGVVVASNLDTKVPEVLSVEGLDLANTVISGQGEIALDATNGNAIRFEKQKGTDWIKGGGKVGYAILILGLISMGLAIFKCIQLATMKFPNMKQVNNYIDALINGEESEAVAIANKQSGIGEKILMAGIKHFKGKRAVIEEVLYEKVSAGRPAMERFLPFMSLTAAAAPLLGLLGTVLGIIKTFQVMAVVGNSGDQSGFTQGISEALVTTAQGLIVAIPVLIFHGMLRAYVRSKMTEAELVSMAIINGRDELKFSA